MRTGKGAYILAVMVFSACLTMIPVAAQAQDSQIYVTPGKESTAKPLFLQRLFGQSGSNAGLGATKPYDFSKSGADRRHDDNDPHSYEKFMAAQQAQALAALQSDLAKQQKAVDQIYAQEAQRQQQESQKRLQEIAMIQSQRAALPPNMPHLNKSATPSGDRAGRREARRRTGRAVGRSTNGASSSAAASQAERPMIYNKQKAEKNAHPPIFLQQ